MVAAVVTTAPVAVISTVVGDTVTSTLESGNRKNGHPFQHPPDGTATPNAPCPAPSVSHKVTGAVAAVRLERGTHKPPRHASSSKHAPTHAPPRLAPLPLSSRPPMTPPPTPAPTPPYRRIDERGGGPGTTVTLTSLAGPSGTARVASAICLRNRYRGMASCTHGWV